MTTRECTVTFPATMPDGGGVEEALQIEVSNRLMHICGNYVAMGPATEYHNRKVGMVNVIIFRIETDEHRFNLLSLAYWLKAMFATDHITVRWDTGVVQRVGAGDDDVKHEWAS